MIKYGGWLYLLSL